MIHVVYTIYKKTSKNAAHDIIVNSDSDWKDGKLVTGGLIDSIRKDYPEEDFIIDVDIITSHGNQTNE
jgi:hypothetical protein